MRCPLWLMRVLYAPGQVSDLARLQGSPAVLVVIGRRLPGYNVTRLAGLPVVLVARVRLARARSVRRGTGRAPVSRLAHQTLHRGCGGWQDGRARTQLERAPGSCSPGSAGTSQCYTARPPPTGGPGCSWLAAPSCISPADPDAPGTPVCRRRGDDPGQAAPDPRNPRQFRVSGH
jgi:hypothetical protein